MNSLLGSVAALAALHCSGMVFAGGEGWTADFAAAKKQAAETKQDLLIDFTGSDWCSWCIKLDKEVFSQAAFKAGVKDKFVLVELDYPHDKSKLSAETLKQNEELGKKYAVQGYPTVLLCDAEGRPFAATGYESGGPEEYVKTLDDMRAKKTARDEAFLSAAKTEGVAKAKALVAALAGMELEDEMIGNFYGDVVAQIKAADPQDETGFAKAATAKARIQKFQAAMEEFAKTEDYAGALALVDKTLKEGGYGNEEGQQLLMSRAMIYAQQQKFDEAIKATDEAKAMDPKSAMAEAMDDFKKQLEGDKKKAAEK